MPAAPRENRPAKGLSEIAAFGFCFPEARLADELENDCAVNQAIDRSHRRHGIFEDAIPLREHEVRGEHERTLLLVAIGKEREERHIAERLAGRGACGSRYHLAHERPAGARRGEMLID